MDSLISRKAAINLVQDLILFHQEDDIVRQLQMLPEMDRWTPMYEGDPPVHKDVVICTDLGGLMLAKMDIDGSFYSGMRDLSRDKVVAWTLCPKPYVTYRRK